MFRQIRQKYPREFEDKNDEAIWKLREENLQVTMKKTSTK